VAPSESLIRSANLHVVCIYRSAGDELDARKTAAHVSGDEHDKDLNRRKSPDVEVLCVQIHALSSRRG